MFSPEKIQRYQSLLLEKKYPDGLENPQSASGQKMLEIVAYLADAQAPVPVLRDYAWAFLRPLCTLFNPPLQWTAADEHLFRIFAQPGLWLPPNRHQSNYAWFVGDASETFLAWLQKQLEQTPEQGAALLDWFNALQAKFALSAEDLMYFISLKSEQGFALLYGPKAAEGERPQPKATFAGLYLESFLPKEINAMIGAAKREHNQKGLLAFFAYLHPHFVESHGAKFSEAHQFAEHAELLLEINAEAYEDFVLKNLENPKINQEIKHRVAYFLWKYLPEKYKEKFIRNCYEYFRNCGFRQDYQSFSRERARFLLEEDPKTFKTFLQQNLATTYLIHHGGWYLNNIGWLLEMVESAWGAESLPLMAEVFKNPDLPKADYAFYRIFLGIFERHQSQAYEEELWKLTKHKSKQVRQFLAGVLAKTGATALPKAKALLYAKTADARQTAAMILAKIQSPEAEAMLLEALNDEKSDDTRDVMVEALGDKFYQKLSPTQIKDFVLAAQARGKLETPAAPWLDEETLPALHFSDDLGLDKRLLTRYLLYRLGRAKTINPETEAKMLLPLLLKEGNAEFAKKLFEAFVSQGADAKHKYCLILAGLLGDDRLVDSLRTQIVKWADSARGKMAEYGVGALALVGSNKALRIVEFFSRKYKTKNANIGTAAAQALEDAAEALGIEANELADSIIPDFGFENLYKIFEAGGEEIRAFIGKDFKMQYLNEGGKVLKSPPKATDKAILDELKDISKELREVVRLQSGRMELYLVIQRKWPLEKWQQFFLANPIMFVYATRLIWAAYDAQGHLQERFYVAEDTSLLNLDDEEVGLAPEAHIAMLHPLMIEESERKAWVSKCFAQGIEPLFPQMQRPVVLLEAQDLHKEAVAEFVGRRGEPAAIKGAFKRYGWVAWGIEDHGDISSFAKNFETMGIRAEIGTGGGLYLGWADTTQAEFYELHFVESSSRKVLKLQEVPPLVYSEVMGELRKIVPQA